MKKSFITLIAGIMIVTLLAGCGNREISNDNITISQYKGLEVEIPAYEMTDAEWDQCVASDMQTVWEKIGIKDRAAVNGDTVAIGYEGTKDGVAFEGGTSELYFLTLGSNSFIDGFEAGIVGHTPGEEFTLNLTFPSSYPQKPELAGQPVVFKVTFKAILPEFSDELIPTLTDNKCKTLDEYKEMRRAEIEKSNEEAMTEEDKAARLQSYAMQKLLENSKVNNYPQSEIDEYVASGEDYYKSYAQYFGMEYEAFCKQYLQMTAEEFKARLTEDAKDYIAMKYAVELIAEEEKMTISDELYNKKLEEYAKEAEMEPDAYEKQAGETSVKQNILADMVAAFVTEHCVEVDSAAKDK